MKTNTTKTTNTKNTKIMKKYNYFYYVWRIPRAEFLKAVPENWQEEVVNGKYRWCGYKAVEIN
ncbi:MAG: hypothetical protein ACOX69_11315 [Coriobacteriales bacterium]|jgi:hypothetical protein